MHEPRFRPRRGEAVTFSGSVVHEMTPPFWSQLSLSALSQALRPTTKGAGSEGSARGSSGRAARLEVGISEDLRQQCPDWTRQPELPGTEGDSKGQTLK
jgi:hypothetical protein